MPSWTAFRMCRTCRKEARQVPVRQVLASYFANFQHLSIILLQQPGQRQGVRWAHGRVNMKHSSNLPCGRTSLSWAHLRAHHRYRTSTQDVLSDPSQRPSQRADLHHSGRVPGRGQPSKSSSPSKRGGSWRCRHESNRRSSESSR